MVRIESLDQDGRGIARADGKVIFINGALPGEIVTYSTYQKKSTYDLANVAEVLRPSSARIEPRCPHFGVCGGCSLQHFDARAQVAAKQRVLEDNFRHIGKVFPGQMLPAIHGEPWAYRGRARFSARYVPKKGGALIGFREKRSSYVSDMTSCAVVPARISALLIPLRALINALSKPDRVPQIEVAVGDNVDVLVVRILEQLSARDEDLLRQFADRHRVQIYLQPRGPDTAKPFHPPHNDTLFYALPEFNLRIAFTPTQFTQVNQGINTVMIRRAIALLDPQPGERVADMFCGLGNFSLAAARSGANVVGMEGGADLVRQAQNNARLNQLEARAEFIQRDLFKIDMASLASLGRFDRMLIDPPRDGAIALVKALAENAPRRIVYVSCNPATLARDAGLLVQVKGYVFSAAGVINMFPHTSHVEAIAVFDQP
jgi:23S rRNA (uracil1939-C5)-methyltransferase